MTTKIHAVIALGIIGLLVDKSQGRENWGGKRQKTQRYCTHINHVPTREVKIKRTFPSSRSHSESSIVTTTQLPQQTTTSGEDVINYLDCDRKDALVAGSVRHIANRKHMTVSLKACPNVTRVILQLRSKGFVQKPKVIFSCNWIHDTVALLRKTTMHSVTFKVVDSTPSDMFSLAWNYELLTEKNSSEWLYPSNTSTELRPREPYSFKGRCGDGHSCVSFGRRGCNHLDCNYSLRYQFFNRSTLVIELSGKTDGWVALGLSSDKKMGGDEVIGCKRTSAHSDKLEAFKGYISLPHSKPRMKSADDLELIRSSYRDGHIYCKIIKTDSFYNVGGDNDLDLTANWYQMYARGPIDSGGVMLQHDEIPPTSRGAVSMLVARKERKYSSVSGVGRSQENPEDPDLGSNLRSSFNLILTLTSCVIMLGARQTPT